MLGVYMSTRKSAARLRQDEALLNAWIVENKVSKFKWFRDPADVSVLPSSPTFAELISDFESGRVNEVLSPDLADHLETLNNILRPLSNLLSNDGLLSAPGTEPMSFHVIAHSVLQVIKGPKSNERGKLISAALNLRKATGSPVGARLGNTNRKGKTLKPDPLMLNEIKQLVNLHSDREIAARVGVSAATICRYRKKFLSSAPLNSSALD